MTLLSLLPTLTPTYVDLILGNTASVTVADACSLGLLSDTPERGLYLHPLLRQFLKTTFLDLPSAVRQSHIDHAFEIFISDSNWDAAFSLIERFDTPRLFTHLLSLAYDDLLSRGRVETLKQWLAYGSANRLASNVSNLVAAEIHLRSGNYPGAEGLAVQAAQASAEQPRVATRAWNVAGNAAFLSDSAHRSLHHYRHAAESASGSEALLLTRWGQLRAALELETEDVEGIMDHDYGPGATTPYEELLVLLSKTALAAQRTGAKDALLIREEALRLLPRITDPWGTSSLLMNCTYLLTAGGCPDRRGISATVPG